jgi:DNA-binding SARP family transcriptional activator
LLFAFFVLHRDRLVRRDELVEALWSEEGPPVGGDGLLRAPLSRLRSALGLGRVEGRGELAVRFPADTWIDFEAVRDGLRESRVSRGAGDFHASWAAARDA